VAQPLVAMSDGRVVGYELLARFPTLDEGPAEVFADAWALGVGVELERKVVELGLRAAAAMDEPDPPYVAINLAPNGLLDPSIADALAEAPPGRVVIEITEHAPVEDYPALRRVLDRLTALGLRVAVDDVGTGFSGLDHILRLEPDLLKIDGALVRDLDVAPGKRAMVAALVTFARKVGATVIAEQVETEAELVALRDLGVTHAQGYHLGRPDPLPHDVQRRAT
jgi:EAL domain-containing protein (putative c-di-GMP-specific phosphodiesterase class I)